MRITHLPTGIVVQCQNERSQSANKQTAMRVLKARLVERAEEEREAMMAKETRWRRGHGVWRRMDPQLCPPSLPTSQGQPHRFRDGNAQAVLDGNLDPFIHAYLLAKAAGKVG